MKLTSNISLGIDISEHRISAAMLKQTKSGIKLVRAGQLPVPPGAITDGNIANPTLLGTAIRKLLKRSRIPLRQAAVSVVARPVLMQIVNLPEELPANINHFLRSEIRHSPVLAGREPQLDYCRMRGSERNGRDRVFVGAIDRDKIDDLLKTLSLAGVEPTAIEFSAAAAARAVYTQRISNRFNANVLVALLHGSEITLSVYRKDELDFVRCLDASGETADPDGYIRRCEQEINAVIQYYDMEILGSQEKWEILAIVENAAIAAGDTEFVLQKSFGLDANVCSPEYVYTCTEIIKNDKIDACSITAAGLAMRSLSVQTSDVAVNLIPQEAEEARAAKKFVLVTANMAAVVMMLIFLAAGFVQTRVNQTQDAMAHRHSETPQEDSIEQLLANQRRVNHQIAYLSDKKDRMTTIFDDQVLDWPEILEEVRKKIPTTLYITRLSSLESGGLIIEGNALSFKSIHVFAELLERSDHFKSAIVAQTQKNPHVSGLVAYSITCTLKNTRM